MFTKKILATSLLVAGLASTGAQAADPTASVVFRGLVGDSIPGSNLIITGNNGAKQIEDGYLLVNQDGTFNTITPVRVEAHTYTPETSEGAGDEIIGAIDETATWKVTGIITLYGGSSSADAVTSVSDIGGAGVDLSTLNTFSDPTGELTLSVENATPVTDVENFNIVTVSVAITAHSGV